MTTQHRHTAVNPIDPSVDRFQIFAALLFQASHGLTPMQAQLHPISARSRSYVGGSAAEREHAAHVAELHAFSAELGERQKTKTHQP
jgi:hypothetical protein